MLWKNFASRRTSVRLRVPKSKEKPCFCSVFPFCTIFRPAKMGCSKMKIPFATAHLSVPFYKSVTVQNIEIGCKPLVKRIGFFAKMRFNKLSDFNNILFAVNQRPDKAAHFIKMNIADFRFLKKLLCNTVEKTLVFNGFQGKRRTPYRI